MRDDDLTSRFLIKTVSILMLRLSTLRNMPIFMYAFIYSPTIVKLTHRRTWCLCALLRAMNRIITMYSSIDRPTTIQMHTWYTIPFAITYIFLSNRVSCFERYSWFSFLYLHTLRACSEKKHTHTIFTDHSCT